jgi:hypothetical protein
MKVLIYLGVAHCSIEFLLYKSATQGSWEELISPLQNKKIKRLAINKNWKLETENFSNFSFAKIDAGSFFRLLLQRFF